MSTRKAAVYFTILLLLALAGYFSWNKLHPSPTEGNTTAQEHKPAEAPLLKVLENFMKLPENERDKFAKQLTQAQKLFNQKRIFDALEALDALDRIFKDHPSSLNIRGACYVEMRDFKKAKAMFERTHNISPDNTNILFNLAEVEFIAKQWESAHTRFTELIPLLHVENKSMIYLSEFKLLLCKLKTNRTDEALALRDKHPEGEDSPYYYYAQAAILFHQGKKIKAEQMLSNAQFIWGRKDKHKKALAPWQDTLIEFGYIQSFYGNN